MLPTDHWLRNSQHSVASLSSILAQFFMFKNNCAHIAEVPNQMSTSLFCSWNNTNSDSLPSLFEAVVWYCVNHVGGKNTRSMCSKTVESPFSQMQYNCWHFPQKPTGSHFNFATLVCTHPRHLQYSPLSMCELGKRFMLSCKLTLSPPWEWVTTALTKHDPQLTSHLSVLVDVLLQGTRSQSVSFVTTVKSDTSNSILSLVFIHETDKDVSRLLLSRL